MFFVKNKQSIDTTKFFGVGVNLDKEADKTKTLVDELGVKNLFMRIPLNDIDNLARYKDFISQFKNYNIVLNILQNREHIDNEALLKKNLYTIFNTFKDTSQEYQIGCTINRSKWGFFSIGEYTRFYKVAQNIRDNHFKNLKLLGPSVIDFEYYNTIHALFSIENIHFDKNSALLYVDRRGAPENTQAGFDFLKKIELLFAITKLSPKCHNKLSITEANWPLKNTAPYAPTSEFECVSEEEYTRYMLRYYLIALGSGMVESVYWHQLIAPGYGLVDNRNGIRKRDAFQALNVLISIVEGSQVLGFKQKQNTYCLSLKKNKQYIDIVWALTPYSKTFKKHYKVLNFLGQEHLALTLEVTEDIHYIFMDH